MYMIKQISSSGLGKNQQFRAPHENTKHLHFWKYTLHLMKLGRLLNFFYNKNIEKISDYHETLLCDELESPR